MDNQLSQYHSAKDPSFPCWLKMFVVQSLSWVWVFVTPWTAMHQASLSFTIFPNFVQTNVHWVSDAIQSSHSLLSPCPLAFFPTMRVFSNESVLRIMWPKYWSFNFSISPSNEYSGLISFRIDWFDLLDVQGPLKSLLHHHNLKASILQCSAFFMVHSHMHTWLLEKP